MCCLFKILLYCEALGFNFVFSMPDPQGKPMLTHIRWAKYADMLLVENNPDNTIKEPKGLGVNFNFTVVEEKIETLAERFKENGVKDISGPIKRVYNSTDLILHDPDGYQLTFSAINLSVDPGKIVEVVKKIQDDIR